MFPFSFSHRTGQQARQKSHEGYEVVTFSREPINLFSAEVRRCEPHWHAAPEFICVLNGRFTILINGHPTTFGPGGMLYISPNEIHGLHAESPESRLLTVQFSPELLEKLHCNLMFDYQVPSAASYTPSDRQVWNAMLALAGDVATNGEHATFHRMSLLYALLTQIERFGVPLKPESKAERKQDDELIKSCLNYIDSHYMDPLTLSDLAHQAGLSYHYFSRLFKRVCGFNFKDYLTFIRVSKTVPLLCDTSIPITDIALQCGFSEHKYLIAAFRKFHNMTPTSFRKKYHAGDGASLLTPDVIAVPVATALAELDIRHKN